MDHKRPEISAADIAGQAEACLIIRRRHESRGGVPLAMVDTYGCQQNEADSETLRGFLSEMGYGFTDDEFEADLVIINTCAVREHAEMRILGNVGALSHAKKKKPGQIIALCGCMVQQQHMKEKIRRSFRIVDLVFGPHELWRFPELLLKTLDSGVRVFEATPQDGTIAEGLPVKRGAPPRAWLSIMYGCNNFCTYCVVPHVRGRERSRRAELILDEARALIGGGYRDITLLGQNVNSYGNDLGAGTDFPELLRKINDIPGEFLIRFMTSHPKDATEKLFRAMAESEKCARHIHLPVQSGSDRVLSAMNRGYDSAKYLSLLETARSYMPELVVTTDIIVGFPGESEQDFEDTLTLVKKARFEAMFTFIYSKRSGTPAAEMPDPATREEKQKRFNRLLEAQNAISAEKHSAYEGKTVRVLIDGRGGDRGYSLTSRTNGGRLVHLNGGADMIGRFADVKITGSTTWALLGEIC